MEYTSIPSGQVGARRNGEALAGTVVLTIAVGLLLPETCDAEDTGMMRPSLEATESAGGAPSLERQSDFEQIFRKFYKPIIYFFARRGLAMEECRDLTQETFMGAFRNFPEYRGDSSVQTWLFRIAWNIWKQSVRARSADKRKADETSLSYLDGVNKQDTLNSGINAQGEEDKNPLGKTLADERLRILHDAIEELPAQMRMCLVLRIYHDLKYREIAEVTQISLQSVKSHLYQARERLREKLSVYFNDIEV